ncbi:MAG: oligopeptide/dipeptide ABC transporter ATP-binding protein [Lysobacterales bacterium]
MSAVLDVRDLHVRYPRALSLAARLGGERHPWVDVVRGVSLQIAPGQTLAVVGESGSGKTTLARALMGLVPSCGGEAHIEGARLARSAHGLLQPDRRRVAMMFQDPVGSLSPRMTVRSALAEPFRIHRTGETDADREALRLLAMVGLGPEFGERYPHQLSGGQARRIGVARALALKPSLLIADEPTAGLDVSIQGDVLNLLSGLQQELGLSILIITHNLNIVRHVADHMAIMYLGRFVEQGPSAEIFRHPRHPYTRALLSANPSHDPGVVAERLQLQGEIPSPSHRPPGCEFHTRCPWVAQDCRSIPPNEREAAPGHRFSCWHPPTAAPQIP